MLLYLNTASGVYQSQVWISRGNVCMQVCTLSAQITAPCLPLACVRSLSVLKTQKKKVKRKLMRFAHLSNIPDSQSAYLYSTVTYCTKRYMHPHTHCSIFIIVKIWKQPRCPSTDEWSKKTWYIYIYFIGTIKYQSFIKRMKF